MVLIAASMQLGTFDVVSSESRQRSSLRNFPGGLKLCKQLFVKEKRLSHRLVHHVVGRFLSPFLTQLRTRTTVVAFRSRLSTDYFSTVTYIQRLQVENPALWSFASPSDLRELWNGSDVQHLPHLTNTSRLDLRLQGGSFVGSLPVTFWGGLKHTGHMWPTVSGDARAGLRCNHCKRTSQKALGLFVTCYCLVLVLLS